MNYYHYGLSGSDRQTQTVRHRFGQTDTDSPSARTKSMDYYTMDCPVRTERQSDRPDGPSDKTNSTKYVAH